MWRNRHLVCHLFSCMVTKLLCHVRGSCSLFQELMWDTAKREPTLQLQLCLQRTTASMSMVPNYLWYRPWYSSSHCSLLPLVTVASCVFLSGTNASGLALSYSIQWSLLCMHYPHCVLCHRWFSNLVLSSGTNKDYWRDCLEEGNEQKPCVLEGKINNRLAVIWKEVRPIRDTKFRIAAARVWTATKICLCHLQNAFPRSTNWVFALPTS